MSKQTKGHLATFGIAALAAVAVIYAYNNVPAIEKALS